MHSIHPCFAALLCCGVTLTLLQRFLLPALLSTFFPAFFHQLPQPFPHAHRGTSGRARDTPLSRGRHLRFPKPPPSHEGGEGPVPPASAPHPPLRRRPGVVYDANFCRGALFEPPSSESPGCGGASSLFQPCIASPAMRSCVTGAPPSCDRMR